MIKNSTVQLLKVYFLILYVNDIYGAVPGENIKILAEHTYLFIFDGDRNKLTQWANNCLKDLDRTTGLRLINLLYFLD